MLLLSVIFLAVVWVTVAAIVLSACVMAARGDRMQHRTAVVASRTDRFARTRLVA